VPLRDIGNSHVPLAISPSVIVQNLSFPLKKKKKKKRKEKKKKKERNKDRIAEIETLVHALAARMSLPSGAWISQDFHLHYVLAAIKFEDQEDRVSSPLFP